MNGRNHRRGRFWPRGDDDWFVVILALLTISILAYGIGSTL